MTIWYTAVLATLTESGLFKSVALEGAKVRAILNENRFLDVHFDPETHSYSYAVIDLALPYAGDKRLFGWDDFPHPGNTDLESLPSHPHHFQSRTPDGAWQFMASSFRGDVADEMIEVISYLRSYLSGELST